MKKFFLFLILINIAFSDSFSFCDKTLKKEFNLYWNYVKNNDLKKMYKMELPYEQYLHNIKEYKKLIKYEKNIKILKIKEIKCYNNKAIIIYKGYNIKHHYKYIDKDVWIKINKKWYHFFEDIPKNLINF